MSTPNGFHDLDLMVPIPTFLPEVRASLSDVDLLIMPIGHKRSAMLFSEKDPNGIEALPLPETQLL